MSDLYQTFKQSFHHQLFIKDFLENRKNNSFASILSTEEYDDIYFDIFMSENEEIRLSKLKKVGMLLGDGIMYGQKSLINFIKNLIMRILLTLMMNLQRKI